SAGRAARGDRARVDGGGGDARLGQSAPRDARGRVRAPRRRDGGRGAEMNAIRSVAVAVFRESVRDRIFYNLVLFAVLLVAASILIGQLTAGQDVKIIKDLGLTATSIFGLFIAVFVGTTL